MGTEEGTCVACTHKAGFYFEADGGLVDACTPIACRPDCAVGQYRSGCSGSDAGQCVACTPVEGMYFVSDGGLTDSCASVKSSAVVVDVTQQDVLASIDLLFSLDNFDETTGCHKSFTGDCLTIKSQARLVETDGVASIECSVQLY